MMHPHTEIRFIDDEIGLGVFATKPIPKGTIVWCLCAFDRIFTHREIEGLAPPHRDLLDRYAFTDIYGNVILCWDAGRYVNHSCRPNMLPLDYGLEILVDDLQVGDQITCDYSELNLVTPLMCRCGEPDCRRAIDKSDAEVLWPLWDDQILEAISGADRIAQPLLEYAIHADKMQRYIDKSCSPPSNVNFYVTDRG